MKTLLAALTVCFATGFLVLVVVIGLQFQDHHRLRAENAALQTRLQAASHQIGDLQQAQAAVVKDLQSRCVEVQELNARLADATEANTNPPVGSLAVPRPYQAPAYLGNQYLGLAWVVPRNVTRNPKTGRFTFEPALVLDPALQAAFAAPATNYDTAATDQVPATPPNYSVYNNYYNSWPWAVWTPGGSAPRPDRPARVPPRPTPNPPPRSPSVTSPWLPVTGPLRSWSPGPMRLRRPDASAGFAPAAIQAAQTPVVRTAAVQ